jgi:hypothetical protein
MFRKFWKPLGLIILILLLMPLSLWAAPIGKISHLEGEADMTTPDGKVALVKASNPVSVGDILRTKAKSKVEVTFLDGNSIFIAERSRLRITRYDNLENKTSTFDLFRGKTRVVVNSLARKSAIELHTPTSVAGVRGTIWIGTYENGVSTFHFERGEGYGYNKNMPDKVVTIRAGQTMEVIAPDRLPVVRPAREPEFNKSLLDTTISRVREQSRETTPVPAPDQNLGAPPPTLPPPSLPPETPPPETTPIVPPPPPPPDTPLVPFVPIVPPTGDLLTPVTGLAGFTGNFDGSLTGGAVWLTGTFNQPATASAAAIGGTGFDGYLAGVPGSWGGLFDAIYNTGGTVRFLKGSLGDSSFTGTTLNATGLLALAPETYATVGAYRAFPVIAMPAFPNVGPAASVSGALGSVYGYETTTGGIIGVGSLATTGGSYASRSWPWTYGYYSGGASPYVFLGEVNGTDDGGGHIAFESSPPARYMDSNYSGTLNLRYRGVYRGQLYDSIGTAQYVLDPLAFSGSVNAAGNVPDYPNAGAFPYLNNGAIAYGGSLGGLFGGISSISNAGSLFTAMGSYDAQGHRVFNTFFNTFRDYTKGLYDYHTGLYLPTGVFSGVRLSNNSMQGKILGLYRIPMMDGEEIGYITGTASGLFYPDSGMWEASGALASEPKVNNDTGSTLGTDAFTGKIIAGGGQAGPITGTRSYLGSQNWGMINAAFAGNYTTQPTVFTAGGSLADGYWMANSTPTITGDSFSGLTTGSFLTSAELGSFTGEAFGILDAQASPKYEGSVLAAYDSQPLAFNGQMAGTASHWYLSAGTGYQMMLDSSSSLSGRIGGTATLFGTIGADSLYPAVDVYGLGVFSNPSGRPLYLTQIQGKDPIALASPNYTLLVGGVAGATSLHGVSQGIYWKPGSIGGTYELGLLTGIGDTPGTIYMGLGTTQTDTGMWKLGDGAQLQAYRLYNNLSSSSAPSISLSNNPETNINIAAFDITGWSGGALVTRAVDARALTPYISGIAQPWGVVSVVHGGTYAAGNPPPIGAQWNQIQNYSGGIGPAAQHLIKTTVTDVQGNLFETQMVDVEIHWCDAPTATASWVNVGGGTTKGQFDPTSSTWQGVMLGMSMEVAAFMNKVSSMSSAERTAFYKATNIPAFNVGATDLRGSSSSYENGIFLGGGQSTSLGIKNVTFFAPTSGAKPQIWAAGGAGGGVSGEYNGSPPVNTIVNLTGYQPGTMISNGITADFNVQKWGSTAGSTWGATVTSGSGTVGGYSIQFQGGAAGTINSIPSTSMMAIPGTFSGTAAGIVK